MSEIESERETEGELETAKEIQMDGYKAGDAGLICVCAANCNLDATILICASAFRLQPAEG